MFLTWCLESKPIQKNPSESLPPPILQGDVTSPGHQSDGHSERKGFTSHLVSFWMRWIFRRFPSPEILEQKKREREEIVWLLRDDSQIFWRFLDQETNPKLPKFFKKLGIFRVCQHQGPRVGARRLVNRILYPFPWRIHGAGILMLT